MTTRAALDVLGGRDRLQIDTVHGRQRGQPGQDVRELALELDTDLPLASRPPRQGDYVFLTETEVNPFAATLHAVVPNFQQYWLVDAITRNSKIPPNHILMLAGYAGAQIVMFLAIGVFLFQRRDVG
jgi:hypothetical protein